MRVARQPAAGAAAVHFVGLAAELTALDRRPQVIADGGVVRCDRFGSLVLGDRNNDEIDVGAGQACWPLTEMRGTL